MIGSSTRARAERFARAPGRGRRTSLADVALGQAKAQHVLGPEGANADPRDDAGVDAAGDGHDGAAPPEPADGLRRPFGEPVEGGSRIERFDGSV